MCLGQIRDVHVVSNASAIGRRIVRPMDNHITAESGRSLQNQGDQVRLRNVIFSVRSIGIGPGSVEVAEGQVPESIRGTEPGHGSLEGELRFTIGVDGVLGMILSNRFGLRHTVGSTGGRKTSGRTPAAAIARKRFKPPPTLVS